MLSTTYLAFTICSNNYLGQALALKQSFLKHNPDFVFVIVLMDKYSDEIDYKQFSPAKFVLAEALDTINLEDLISKYYIIELNTCIKASAFKYLIKRNPNLEVIYYLDPDLYFYNSLDSLNEKLKTKAAVLTPHILTQIERDGKFPEENTFLQYGVFNLGFLGLNPKKESTKKILDWWEHRTLNFGYDSVHKGYFVDQLWMNFLPVFYDDIEIIKSYGYNMAPWNLHERRIISVEANKILLNDNSELVFYHFSKISNKYQISKEYNRFDLLDFPLLRTLYIDYKSVLKALNYEKFKGITIAYPVRLTLQETPKEKRRKFVKNESWLKKILKKILV
ncbi:glycosyltransferase [uncultured Algibacter sp.]|uniref:glycosyltransferase n=1 Tax=uncultured Algibacter sp. TaxID=298659 RepID=UPI00262BDD43|nr:glycosyltransferase [uncultured Algibacter sp.]